MCLSITLPNVTTTVIKNTQVISSVHLVCLDLEAEPCNQTSFYNKSLYRRSSHLSLRQNLELLPLEQIQFCYIKFDTSPSRVSKTSKRRFFSRAKFSNSFIRNVAIPCFLADVSTMSFSTSAL